jgi:hypothetical protein
VGALVAVGTDADDAEVVEVPQPLNIKAKSTKIPIHRDFFIRVSFILYIKQSGIV